jgi:hypothetical protein
LCEQDAEFQGIPQRTGIKVKKINLRAKKILPRGYSEEGLSISLTD